MGVLASARQPLPPPPSGWQVCLMLNGPSLFQTVYHRCVPGDGRLSGWAAGCRGWLAEFERLRHAPDPVAGEALAGCILDGIAWEEEHVYKPLRRLLPSDRALRDLGYEHQGLRRGLPRFAAVLQSMLDQPEAARTAWSRYQIEVVHLLEHHLEHEERGAWPLFERTAT